MESTTYKPTAAFVGASWAALGIGTLSYLAALWNSAMLLNEKGFYFVLILFGLFAAVSLQKSVRDRLEGIAVTDLYYGLCWIGLGLSGLLMLIGLWNAELPRSEKGFYGISFLFSLFGATAVQKNVRDMAKR
jgi:uncharacterized membrane protein YiaA